MCVGMGMGDGGEGVGGGDGGCLLLHRPLPPVSSLGSGASGKYSFSDSGNAPQSYAGSQRAAVWRRGMGDDGDMIPLPALTFNRQGGKHRGTQNHPSERGTLLDRRHRDLGGGRELW